MASLVISAGLAFASMAPAPFRSITFEPNVGQTDVRVKYLAHAPHATLWLAPKGAVLSTLAGRDPKSGRAVLKLRFEGANRSPRIEGEDLRPGVSNYFLGPDPVGWHTGIQHFGKVRYRNVYPGIDIVFYGNPQGFEYDFIVRAGADPAKIRLAFEGVDRMVVDANGDLALKVGSVEIRNRKPRIYQGDAQDGQFVAGHYVVLGKGRAGFALDRYDATKPLVVDPVLTYATFLGGHGSDSVRSMAMDAQGNLYLTGSTDSANFPTKAGAYKTIGNQSRVAFVAKMNPAASGESSLVYATFLGGNTFDQAFGIAIDSSGNAYVTGHTLSTNFPVKNGFQTSINTATNCTDQFGSAAACSHSFVSKISATGSALIYSSYLGGSGEDDASGIAVDGAGHAYITGTTFSTDFPTGGSVYQGSQKGSGDAFLSEVSADGKTLLTSTYFGGTKQDGGSSIVVTSSGMVYIAGSTASQDLPVAGNAYQPTASATGGNFDAFVAEFNPKLTGAQQLVYSSYLGAATGGTYANAVAVDSQGNIYLTGATNATDFPVTSSAYRQGFSGAILNSDGTQGVGDAFVTKLNPSAQAAAQLAYSTYFGGDLDDQGLSIAVDNVGRVTIAGQTNSDTLPVTPSALQHRNDGPSPSDKGFIAWFDPSKSGSASLLYSTYIGGTASDDLYSLAIDKTGNSVAVAGTAFSPDAPVTPSAYQKSYGGSDGSFGDAYVARFDFSITGPVCTTIVNGASFVDTGLSPGLIFTLKGSGMGPAVGENTQLDSEGRVATTLAGVQVLVGGIPAPLLFVRHDQINAVVPYEIASRLGELVNTQVIYNGALGNLIADTAVSTAPAIFSLGNGQGAILNQDNSVNGSGNPAAKGSTIQIFATGEGETNPTGIDGRIADDSFSKLPRPQAKVSVTIGSFPAAITYAGTAPQSFEGFFQVNAKIPANVASGNLRVVLTVGNTSSPPLNVAVK